MKPANVIGEITVFRGIYTFDFFYFNCCISKLIRSTYLRFLAWKSTHLVCTPYPLNVDLGTVHIYKFVYLKGFNENAIYLTREI